MAELFGDLEKEVSTWAQANADKLPNANSEGLSDEDEDNDYNEEHE